MEASEEEAKVLRLRARFYVQDTDEVRTLIEILTLTFPQGCFALSTASGRQRLEIDVDTTINERQGETFLQVMRALDNLVVDTVFLNGRLGKHTIHGYIGPDREKKEQSRNRLDHIMQQIPLLLPEHREALMTLLATS
jgi:hypothetical protein